MQESRAERLGEPDDAEATPRDGGPCPCCGDPLVAGAAGAPACEICGYPANSSAWVVHDGC